MKLFECQACGQPLYFENDHCGNCGRRLGFHARLMQLSALDPRGDGTWTVLAAPDQPMRLCANAGHGVCSWLTEPDNPSGFCRACDLNRTIPDLSQGDNLELWGRLEEAKHRLVYSLLRLGLPVARRSEGHKGLIFDFLAMPEPAFWDTPETVLTGHAQGLITINIAEADDAAREAMRDQMAEPYRTVLGHFRHEVGHYYWERLVAGTERLEPFRRMFGDERADYARALETHYANGPASDWADAHISTYAASHPWEDWAETWAHYLHMVDTLETAYEFGLSVEPRVGKGRGMSGDASFDPYGEADFQRILSAWLPMTYAVNSLNRSMGHADLYPFVLSPVVIEKFKFVHTIIREAAHSN